MAAQKFTDYVNEFSDEEIAECIADHSAFEGAGAIDDCMLRSKVRGYCEKYMPGVTYSIIMWMNMLAFECYRVENKRLKEKIVNLKGMLAKIGG